jgi:hypothetical protein
MAALTTGAKIAAGAGAGLIVGALMPWAVLTAPFVGQLTRSGMDGDGLFTAGMGLVAIIVALVSNGSRKYLWLLLLAVAAGGIALIDIVDIASMGDEDVLVSVGTGLYVTLLAAGVLLWAAILVKREPSAGPDLQPVDSVPASEAAPAFPADVDEANRPPT